LCTACLALAELVASGVPMPRRLFFVTFGVFLVSAVIEGVITLAAVRAIEKLLPGSVRRPAESGSRAIAIVALVAIALAIGGVLVASTDPDGIQKLASAQSPRWLHAPLADYQIHGIDSAWLRRAGAGVAGLILIYGVCAFTGKILTRRRTS